MIQTVTSILLIVTEKRRTSWSPNDNNYQNIYDHVYSIFSAIKLKNPDGSQKIIKVNKLDQLYIRYTLRKYMPKYVSAKSTVITTLEVLDIQ